MGGVPKDRCLVCRSKLEGLRFCGATICSACEKIIVRSRPGDSDYDFLVQQIKNFWVSSTAWSM
ncbi:MAG: sigma factor G inhibitor Gin [Limnochordia bacterium]|jgi:hypothetical protein